VGGVGATHRHDNRDPMFGEGCTPYQRLQTGALLRYGVYEPYLHLSLLTDECLGPYCTKIAGGGMAARGVDRTWRQMQVPGGALYGRYVCMRWRQVGSCDADQHQASSLQEPVLYICTTAQHLQGVNATSGWVNQCCITCGRMAEMQTLLLAGSALRGCYLRTQNNKSTDGSVGSLSRSVCASLHQPSTMCGQTACSLTTTTLCTRNVQGGQPRRAARPTT
jgi:hypothetical protein